MLHRKMADSAFPYDSLARRRPPPAGPPAGAVVLLAVAAVLLVLTVVVGPQLAGWTARPSPAAGQVAVAIPPLAIGEIALERVGTEDPATWSLPGPSLTPRELAMLVASPVAVPPPPEWWADRALESALRAATPGYGGQVTVAARHLGTGAYAAIGGDLAMPPASVYKLGVLAEAMREVEEGTLLLSERLLLLPEDWADGAGVLQGRIGESVSVQEALRLMIGISDNTAALALLRRLGADALNAEYVRLGLSRTHFFPDDRPDVTTAADTATLLELLATGQLADGLRTRMMLELLTQDQPQAWIQWALPAGVPVAHKSGQLPGTRNDAAIVYGSGGPFVLVVLTDGFWDEDEGEAAVRALGRAAWAYFEGVPAGTAAR